MDTPKNDKAALIDSVATWEDQVEAVSTAGGSDLMNEEIRNDCLSSAAQTKTNGIVVASTSLAALFRGDAIVASDGTFIRGTLHLPEYQRPYRWGQRQLTRLLDDLRRFFKSDTATDVPGHDFYLGSIILHQKQLVTTESEQLNIIDGQQRLTSMALLAYKLGMSQAVPELYFSAPESQNRIRANLRWLDKERLPPVDFSRVNVTLVVTRSEDDAYRFFETQNTGGVRLGGPDIIKAHHLRAIARSRQNEYARLWEVMGDLKPLVDALMKARHWQTLKWRDLAGHREPTKEREEIVAELAERTSNQPLDLAYRQVLFCHSIGAWSQHLDANGYAMRQPLNAGVNVIHYLQFFHQLRQQLLVAQSEPELEDFYWVYKNLVVQANGSAFLRRLYDSAILLYASQFGCRQLFEASLWLFRAIYSPRLTNEKMVRESTAQKFARENPVLDWIAASYNHEQLMQFLRDFTYDVDPNNLDEPGVKLHFVQCVKAQLGMVSLPKEGEALALAYDHALQEAIQQKTMIRSVHNEASQ
jgi:hypothetical protein